VQQTTKLKTQTTTTNQQPRQNKMKLLFMSLIVVLAIITNIEAVTDASQAAAAVHGDTKESIGLHVIAMPTASLTRKISMSSSPKAKRPKVKHDTPMADDDDDDGGGDTSADDDIDKDENTPDATTTATNNSEDVFGNASLKTLTDIDKIDKFLEAIRLANGTGKGTVFEVRACIDTNRRRHKTEVCRVPLFLLPTAYFKRVLGLPQRGDMIAVDAVDIDTKQLKKSLDNGDEWLPLPLKLVQMKHHERALTTPALGGMVIMQQRWRHITSTRPDIAKAVIPFEVVSSGSGFTKTLIRDATTLVNMSIDKQRMPVTFTVQPGLMTTVNDDKEKEKPKKKKRKREEVANCKDEKDEVKLSEMQVAALTKMEKHMSTNDDNVYDPEAVKSFRALEMHESTFLLDVAAGAGKTRINLELARRQAIRSGVSSLVVIVAKSNRSVRQYANEWSEAFSDNDDVVVVTKLDTSMMKPKDNKLDDTSDTSDTSSDDTSDESSDDDNDDDPVKPTILVISRFATASLMKLKHDNCKLVIVDEGHELSTQSDVATKNNHRQAVILAITTQLKPSVVVLSTATPLHCFSKLTTRRFEFTYTDAVKAGIVTPLEVHMMHTTGVDTSQDLIEMTRLIATDAVPKPAVVRCSNTANARAVADRLSKNSKLKIYRMWSGKGGTKDLPPTLPPNTVVVSVDMAVGDLNKPEIKSCVDTVGSHDSMIVHGQFATRATRRHDSKLVAHYFTPCRAGDVKSTVKVMWLLARSLGCTVNDITKGASHHRPTSAKKQRRNDEDSMLHIDALRTDINAAVTKSMGNVAKMTAFVNGVINKDAKVSERRTKVEIEALKAAKAAAAQVRLTKREQVIALGERWFRLSEDNENIVVGKSDDGTLTCTKVVRRPRKKSKTDPIEKSLAQMIGKMNLSDVDKSLNKALQTKWMTSLPAYAVYVKDTMAQRRSVTSPGFNKCTADTVANVTDTTSLTRKEHFKKLKNKSSKSYINDHLAKAANGNDGAKKSSKVDWQYLLEKMRDTTSVSWSYRHTYNSTIEFINHAHSEKLASATVANAEGLTAKGKLLLKYRRDHGDKWPTRSTTITIPLIDINGINNIPGRPTTTKVNIGSYLNSLRQYVNGTMKMTPLMKIELSAFVKILGKTFETVMW
jgi:hypothetical protein